jgi:hypothetical protein
MKPIAALLFGLAVLGFGVFLLFTGEPEPATGTVCVLFGVILATGSVVMFGQRHEDSRAGGGRRPVRGPYLLLSELIMALGAAVGLIMIIYLPVAEYGYPRRPQTPTEARIWGFLLVGLCLVGAVVLLVRASRARRS